MFEIQITIPDLSEALKVLATAIAGRASVLMQSAVTTTPKKPSSTPASAPAHKPEPTSAVTSASIPVHNPDPVSAVTPAPVAAPAAPTAQKPVPTGAPTAQKPVPTGAPQYTLDMLATAGSALIDAGKMDQLVQLLTKFGVASLTDLQPEHYGAVANELRALGAAI